MSFIDVFAGLGVLAVVGDPGRRGRPEGQAPGVDEVRVLQLSHAELVGDQVRLSEANFVASLGTTSPLASFANPEKPKSVLFRAHLTPFGPC